VDFTLPAEVSGLTDGGVILLNNAKANGVDVNLVNIMTMDYGSTYDMGQVAIDAAKATHTQLGNIWTGLSSAQLWQLAGNTPMIGVNDNTNDVFSTSDANQLDQGSVIRTYQPYARTQVPVLPAPFGSNSPKNSPRATARSMPRTASTTPLSVT